MRPARTQRWPLRAARAAVHVVALRPLLNRAVALDVHGVDELRDLAGPVVVAANHSSHLDTPVLLATLPPRLRRRTSVAVPPDYFDARWQQAASTVALATIASRPDRPQPIEQGWSVLVYPEGSRAGDGHLGAFGPSAAELALDHGVAVLPVGVRGTYAAMPRGRRWPLPGRTRVSVRYGAVLHPAPGESVASMSRRIEAAVAALVTEDVTSWWQVRRGRATAAAIPAGSWRRVWAETTPPVAGGTAAPRTIWRR